MKIGKRYRLIMSVVIVWILFAGLGIAKSLNFQDLATYFGALTLFIGNYIIAEGKRSSGKGGFCKSKREFTTYLVYTIWIAAGLMAILIPNEISVNLTDLSMYFTSLSGFIAAYVWSETFKESKK